MSNRMTNPFLRAASIALLLTIGLGAAMAQETKVRVKVKADLAAPPDRELGLSKMAYGDPGSIVALKTRGGRMALGGLTEQELGWNLYVIASDKMNEIKHDRPRFVWGIGAVALETIETFNKQFRVILSKPDREKGRLLLLQQELSPRSLTGRAAALITSIPYDLLGKAPEYFKEGMTVGFTTVLAQDGQHMLISLTPATTTHSAGSPILGVMVDKQMNPLWTNRLHPEAGNVRTDVVNTMVDGQGVAWYLVRNVTDADPKTKDVVGYSYSVYRMDSTGQKGFPLDLGKKDFVQDAAMAFMPNGALACAGIYSNPDANRDESVGVFYTVLNAAEDKWTSVARTPFNKRTVDKVERLQNNMRVERIWPKTDGGLYVVCERSGVETHMVSNLSGQKVAKTEWVNGAFHALALDGSGQMKWYTEVPREMSYTNDGPGKAFSVSFADVLFLFYNDDARNIELRKKKQPVDPVDKPKDALMLEFKNDGSYKEKAVLSEGLTRGYFDADALWLMGNGLIGLEGAPDFKKDRTFPVLIDMTEGSGR